MFGTRFVELGIQDYLEVIVSGGVDTSGGAGDEDITIGDKSNLGFLWTVAPSKGER